MPSSTRFHCIKQVDLPKTKTIVVLVHPLSICFWCLTSYYLSCKYSCSALCHLLTCFILHMSLYSWFTLLLLIDHTFSPTMGLIFRIILSSGIIVVLGMDFHYFFFRTIKSLTVLFDICSADPYPFLCDAVNLMLLLLKRN